MGSCQARMQPSGVSDCSVWYASPRPISRVTSSLGPPLSFGDSLYTVLEHWGGE